MKIENLTDEWIDMISRVVVAGIAVRHNFREDALQAARLEACSLRSRLQARARENPNFAIRKTFFEFAIKKAVYRALREEQGHDHAKDQAERTPAKPEQRVHRDELAQLRSAFSKLSPADRQLLLLRASGFSFSKIARTNSVPRSTVHHFTRRAMGLLRENMGAATPRAKDPCRPVAPRPRGDLVHAWIAPADDQADNTQHAVVSPSSLAG